MELVINPQLPYVGAISHNFTPGKWLKIYGSVPAQARGFTINLQCSAKTTIPDDVALKVLVNIQDDSLLVNSIRTGICNEAQTILGNPIKRGQKFEIAIIYDFTQYKISINGEHSCGYPQTISYDRVTHLAIDGDVLIEKIFYETDTYAPSRTVGPPPCGFVIQTAIQPPPLGFIEQPLPCAANAMNYGACPLPPPVPGMPPYPTAGPFAPAVFDCQSYPIQSSASPTQPSTTVASSNTPPIKSRSIRQTCTSCACIATVLLLVLLML